MLGLDAPFIAVVKEFLQPLVLKALDHNQSVTFSVTFVNFCAIRRRRRRCQGCVLTTEPYTGATASHAVGHDEFLYVPFPRLGKKKDAAIVYPYQ